MATSAVGAIATGPVSGTYRWPSHLATPFARQPPISQNQPLVGSARCGADGAGIQKDPELRETPSAEIS